MPPDHPSRQREVNSPSVLAKIAALGIALNLPTSEAEVQAQISEVKEMGTRAVTQTEHTLPTHKETEAETEFHLPNETVTEAGVKATLVEVARAYPGLKIIAKFEGNGGRDALIYIPEGFDPNEPIELVYHFHGTNGELIDEKYPAIPGANARYEGWVRQGKIAPGSDRLGQVLDEAIESEQAGGNKIVVYPLSAGQRGPEGSAAEKNGYDAQWMKKGNSTGDDMKKFDDAVRQRVADELNLNALNISEVTLKGHSAGGQPLKNIALSGFAADRIDFLDASYGWAKSAYQVAIKNNPEVEFNVFTIPGTATSADAMSLKGKKGVEVIEVQDVVHANMNRNFFNWERKKKTDPPNTHQGTH